MPQIEKIWVSLMHPHSRLISSSKAAFPHFFGDHILPLIFFKLRLSFLLRFPAGNITLLPAVSAKTAK